MTDQSVGRDRIMPWQYGPRTFLQGTRPAFEFRPYVYRGTGEDIYAPPRRCNQCGYLTSAIGHQMACREAS